MYGLVRSSRAKKAFRKYEKSGWFPLAKFKVAVAHLRAGTPLPAAFLDHQLKGSLSMFREFHLAQDLLVQYIRDDKTRVVTITDVGTHDDLFGR